MASTANSAALRSEQRRVRIKRIVCDILEVAPEEMTGTSRFREEHAGNSMDAIEILTAVEHELGVEIDQSELPRIVNLDGIAAVVEDAVRRCADPAGHEG